MPVEETYEDILTNQPGYGEEEQEEALDETDKEPEEQEAGQPPADDTDPPEDTPAPPPEDSPEIKALKQSNDELRSMVRELTEAVMAGQKKPESAPEEVDLGKVIDETFEPEAAKAMKRVLALQEQQLERKYKPTMQQLTQAQQQTAAERMESDALAAIAKEEGLSTEEAETLKAEARKEAWAMHERGEQVPPPKYVMADVVRKMKRQKGYKAADKEIAKQNDVREHRNKNAGNPSGAPPATKGKVSLSRKDLRGKSTLERLEMADAAED